MSPRPPKYRFYIDENFPAPAGKFLRSLGHNVIHVVELKSLRALSDLQQLKETNRQKRVFVALDKDFRTNKTLWGEIEKGEGIILIESSDPSSEKIMPILQNLLTQVSERKLKGKICRASVDKIKFEKIK